MQFFNTIIKKIFKLSQASGKTAQSQYHRAIDLGRTRVFFAEGKVVAHKLYLNQLVSVPLTANMDLPAALKKLFDDEQHSRDEIRISLKSPQVITRFLRFPKMTEQELRGVLQFEIEQYVPYEAKDLYMDLSVLQESVKVDQNENTEIFVAVAKKDYLDPLVKQFRDIQSEVSVVDVDMLACMKSLEFFHAQDYKGHAAILDLGVHVSTLGVVRASLPRFIRDLSFGTQDITKKLKSRAALTDASIVEFIEGRLEAAPDQYAGFTDSIESLINDVKVSFDFYRDQSEDGASPDKLFVCGLGSNQKFILEALQKSLDIPIFNIDISSNLEFSPTVSRDLFNAILPDLPVLMGLLLREHD